jgi:peptide/nickel transport system substrate-binding protein
MPLTRRTLLATSAASLALPVHAQSQPTLRVVAPWEVTSLEPSDTGYIFLRMEVAETLVGVEPNGQLVGLVAERWAVDEDRLTWRFALRDKRFHDGSPVTAAAVVASLERVRAAGESLGGVPIERIEAAGSMVIIRTSRPFSPLPAFLADYASIILAPAAYGADGKVQRMIATGPYRVTRVEGATGFDLEAADSATPPAIRAVSYRAVGNGDTRGAMAIAGDADLIFTLAPQALPRITAAGRTKVLTETIARARKMSFDCARPQFREVEVRRAISLAIDRAGIARALLRHEPSTATQLLPPVLTGWHQPHLPPLAFNPAEARRMLDQAGWRPGADGVRVKDGVPLSFEVKTIANRPELPAMAAAIQANLADVGIRITIQAGPTGAVPQAVRDRTLQASFFARTYVNIPDPIGTLLPDFTNERAAWGAVNWGNKAFADLAHAYTASFDAAERAGLQRRMAELLHDELPTIPVSWFEHTAAASTRLANVVLDPYETRYLVSRMRWL